MTEVLVVCTANLCRSPIAEALLVDELERAAVSATVRSAGVGASVGLRPPDAVIEMMEGRGLDLGEHLSRRVTIADIEAADVVVAMERAHVREMVVILPGAFGRIFTLKEIVRRAGAVGARAPGEHLSDWIERLNSGRRASALLGSDPEDDVSDPMGGTPEQLRRAADEIAGLVAGLVAVMFPEP